MEIKGGVAHAFDSRAELLDGAGLIAEGNRNFEALAKIKALERSLPREIGIGVAIIRRDTAQIAAQRRYGQIIPNIEGRQLFRQIAVIGVGEHPLREIVRESFRQKVMAAK